MKNDKEILKELLNIYPSGIKPVEPFPKPYPPVVNPEKVKAIYLGCDPSNVHTDELSYVFALVDTPKKFKGFVTLHANQLEAIGLELKDVFVQNLCRNYFEKETSKNLPVWKKVAKEYWIEELKAELDELKIPTAVPILLTSKYLYDVLINDKNWAGYESPELYEKELIPVPANANLLHRPLIPVYRGYSPRIKRSYNLSKKGNWESYRQKAKIILEQN